MFVILIGDYCIRTLDVDRFSRSKNIRIIGMGDMGFRFICRIKSCTVEPLKGLMFNPVNSDHGLETANKTILWILLAAGLAILLGLLSVLAESVKVVNRNPVESIKNE